MQKWFGVILITLALSLPAAAANDEIVFSGHPDYPPFMWEYDKTLVGVGPVLVRDIFQHIGETAVIQSTGSWARAQQMVEKNHFVGLVGAYSNETRRSYMAYSEAYAVDPTSVFVLKDNPFVMSSRDDLIPKRGVTMFGDSFGDELDRFIKDKLTITRAYDSDSLFKHLTSRRMDYILWGDYPCQINARIRGIDRQISKTGKPLTHEGMHITISKKSPYSEWIPRINQRIEKLKSDGTIKAWFDHYLTLYVQSRKYIEKSNSRPGMTVLLDKDACEGDPGAVTGKVSIKNVIDELQKRCGVKISTHYISDHSELNRFGTASNSILFVRSGHLLHKTTHKLLFKINGIACLANPEKFDPSLLSRWQLGFEAIKNDGTLSRLSQ